MKDVNNILGKEDEIDFRGVHYYYGLHIFYRDNIIVGLSVATGDNLTNRYKTQRKNGLGDAKNDVLSRYGAESLSVNDSYGNKELILKGKKKGNVIETEDTGDPFWGTEDLDSIVIIDFVCHDNEKHTVSMIYISDFRNAYIGS